MVPKGDGFTIHNRAAQSADTYRYVNNRIHSLWLYTYILIFKINTNPIQPPSSQIMNMANWLFLQVVCRFVYNGRTAHEKCWKIISQRISFMPFCSLHCGLWFYLFPNILYLLPRFFPAFFSCFYFGYNFLRAFVSRIWRLRKLAFYSAQTNSNAIDTPRTKNKA